MPNRPDENLEEKFEHLFRILSDRAFLTRPGIGNEIPFFISAYHPQLQERMDAHIRGLLARLRSSGVTVEHIDLYDLAVEILKAQEIWEPLLDAEKDFPRDRYLEALQSSTDPESVLVPAIEARLASSGCGLLFLTGVGTVHPFIRIHKVLETLQRVATTHPTVIFFPGEYGASSLRGTALTLFDLPRSDRYYRAFNLADFIA